MWVWIAVALAGVGTEMYRPAVELVDELYLRPTDVDPVLMLQRSARAMERRIPWLFVENTDTGVVLHHGGNGRLGQVDVRDVHTLAFGLEQLGNTLRAGGDVGSFDLDRILLREALGELDPYTTVIAGNRLHDFDVRLEGRAVGVGMKLAMVDDAIQVAGVERDSPAERAELQPGDRIVRIDRVSTVGMPAREAARRLRGEDGSLVKLSLLHEGQPAEVVLRRERVEISNVTWKVLEDDVGYVRITHVSKRTLLHLRQALAALRARDALSPGLVIDLRGNTGGSLRQSAAVVDQFVQTGPIVATVGRTGGPVPNLVSDLRAGSQGDEPPVPIAVLVDGRTASGAEIIAAALQGLDRAVIIGSQTYGKGVVQKLYSLGDAAALKMTVAEYVVAGDRRVDGVGVKPDLELVRYHFDRHGVHGHNTQAEGLQVSYAWEDRAFRDREPYHPDAGLELARQAVYQAADESRKATLASLSSVAKELGTSWEADLVERMASTGIDWSAGIGDTPVASADVETVTDGGVTRLQARLENQGISPIYRANLVLSAPWFSLWDDLQIPVGKITSGDVGYGTIRVDLPPGVRDRFDQVQVQLASAGHREVDVGAAGLQVSGPELARMPVSVKLEQAGTGLLARVSVRNQDATALQGVEVWLERGAGVPVELLDHGVRIGELAGKSSAEVTLRLQPLADLTELPLRVRVEADAQGELLDLRAVLPLSGEAVPLDPPRIAVRTAASRAPVGDWTLPMSLTDDTGLRWVTVTLNGRKVAWKELARLRAEPKFALDLKEGANQILVRVGDAQGYSTAYSFSMWGDSK